MQGPDRRPDHDPDRRAFLRPARVRRSSVRWAERIHARRALYESFKAMPEEELSRWAAEHPLDVARLERAVAKRRKKREARA